MFLRPMRSFVAWPINWPEPLATTETLTEALDMAANCAEVKDVLVEVTVEWRMSAFRWHLTCVREICQMERGKVHIR